MSWNEVRVGWRGGARALVVGCMLLLTPAVTGQTLAHRGWAGSGIEVPPWWASAVFYEVDPLTFQDSDGDGFGDLAGIVQRLDYLKSLGVDAVLLSPYQIAPGTAQTAQQEEEFAHLASELGRRQMRLLVDLPLDGGTPGARPPGLETLLATARFWLSRGAAGLRLTGQVGSPDAQPVVRALQQLAAGLGGERVLLVASPLVPTPGSSLPAEAISFRRAGHGRRHTQPGSRAAGAELRVAAVERQMPGLSADGLRALIAGQAAGGLDALTTDSANQARSWDRYADGQHDLAIAKMLATVLFTGRAAPLLLYGQELGMATTPEPAAGKESPGNPLPMSWGGEKGFTAGSAWVEASRNLSQASVAVEDAAPDSLLAWYRKLSVLEHAKPALRGGSLTLLAMPEPAVVGWLRQAPRGGVLAPPVVILCNASAHEQVVSLAHALAQAGIAVGTAARLRLLAASAPNPAGAMPEPVPAVAAVVLPPYGVVVAEIAPRPGLEDQPAPYVHPRRRGR